MNMPRYRPFGTTISVSRRWRELHSWIAFVCLFALLLARGMAMLSIELKLTSAKLTRSLGGRALQQRAPGQGRTCKVTVARFVCVL